MRQISLFLVTLYSNNIKFLFFPLLWDKCFEIYVVTSTVALVAVPCYREYLFIINIIIKRGAPYIPSSVPIQLILRAFQFSGDVYYTNFCETRDRCRSFVSSIISFSIHIFHIKLISTHESRNIFHVCSISFSLFHSLYLSNYYSLAFFLSF